jgi:hypothetical protein
MLGEIVEKSISQSLTLDEPSLNERNRHAQGSRLGVESKRREGQQEKVALSREFSGNWIR